MENCSTFNNNETVTVMSFQSKEVWDIVIDKGIYVPDPSFTREKRDYKLDIEQLDGNQPVWGFVSRHANGFQPADFLDSSLLELYRCEMSVDEDRLKDFMVLELEVPRGLVKRGLTHNSYDYAVVFPTIRKEWLVSVGKVEILEFPKAIGYRHLVPLVTYKETSRVLYSVVESIRDIHSTLGWGGLVSLVADNRSTLVFSESNDILYELEVKDRKVHIEIQTGLEEREISSLLQSLELYFKSIGVESISHSLAEDLVNLSQSK